MTNLQCQRANCKEEAYSMVAYLKKWLCLKHVNELGDFDQKGRLADKRVKRQ